MIRNFEQELAGFQARRQQVQDELTSAQQQLQSKQDRFNQDEQFRQEEAARLSIGIHREIGEILVQRKASTQGEPSKSIMQLFSLWSRYRTSVPQELAPEELWRYWTLPPQPVDLLDGTSTNVTIEAVGGKSPASALRTFTRIQDFHLFLETNPEGGMIWTKNSDQFTRDHPANPIEARFFRNIVRSAFGRHSVN